VVRSAFAAPPAVTSLFPAGAQRGTTVEVTAAGKFERWPVQAWVSGRGVEVKPDKGKLSVTVAADALPGTYWLRLYDEEGASSLRPFLVGTLPEVREREPNDDPKSPQRLDGPCVVNGKLEKAGDVDGFAIDCRQGQTLVAALEANATLRSPMDGVLQIVSPDGFVLAQDNDTHGLDPFLAFPVPKDGTYVVRTFAFPATPDSGIRFAGGEAFVYRLTVTTGGYADYPWPLAVSRAKPGRVELVGWNLPPSRLRLSALDRDEESLVHPANANAPRVRVEPHACAIKPAGSEPFAITPPMTVSGRLAHPKAADVFTFTAVKGDKLNFRVEARALGLPLVAGLHLSDAAGKELAKTDPPGFDKDAELAFTAPQDGNYRLTVRDYYENGGPRYVYRLRVTRPEPDFAVALKADRFTIEAGKLLDIAGTLQRLNGFTGDVDLSAEGLPPGVEVIPPDPAAKPGSPPTLRLSAKADAKGSGPLRIVARPRVWPPNFTRAATAPLADLGISAADLWLTVTRPAEKKPAEEKAK
jgi:hypothetical protein